MDSPQEPSRNHDPSPFNVRQYEEEYGPGGVSPDYTFHAKMPVQNPHGIRILGVVLFVIACVPIYPATMSGFALPGTPYAGLLFVGATAAGVRAFISNLREEYGVARGHSNLVIQAKAAVARWCETASCLFAG